jgi:hypothetical protein
LGNEKAKVKDIPISWVVFGKGLDWKKWIGIVADLIDRRKKIRIFCIEK